MKLVNKTLCTVLLVSSCNRLDALVSGRGRFGCKRLNNGTPWGTVLRVSTTTTIENVSYRANDEASYLLPNQSELEMDSSVPFSETLKNRGVSRVDSGLSSDVAGKMQQYIDKTLQLSLDEVNGYKVPRAFRFANVLESGNRWDLLLPFDDEGSNEDGESNLVVMDALEELLGENGTIGPIIEEILGENAILYELACLISDPGSKKQEIHPDIEFQANGAIPLIACFVSLQDIDSTMGPTVFIPDTVTAEHHRRINDLSLADDMLRTIPSCISTLRAGDCSLYNPMVLVSLNLYEKVKCHSYDVLFSCSSNSN